MHHAPDRFGGFSYELVLYNDADVATDISLRVEGAARLPEGFTVTLVDPVEGVQQRQEGAYAVRVPAKGRVHRLLAVGGGGYAAVWLKNVKPFARFALGPNPFRGALAMRFMMPEGVGRVECRLFDPLGRVVWRHVARGVRGGRMMQVVYDGRTSAGRPLAAGTYVLKLSAFDTRGGHMKSLKRQVMAVR
jgi:hypothetical protein